jgi:hypothetical protein
MIFPLINVKTFLVGFVGYAIALFLTDQQLAALHVIVHNIFKCRHILLIVETIEVDILKSCQLEPIRVFDVVDRPSIFYLVVLGPLHLTCHVIILLSEEFDFSRRANYQALIIYQNNFSNISIKNCG